MVSDLAKKARRRERRLARKAAAGLPIKEPVKKKERTIQVAFDPSRIKTETHKYKGQTIEEKQGWFHWRTFRFLTWTGITGRIDQELKGG